MVRKLKRILNHSAYEVVLTTTALGHPRQSNYKYGMILPDTCQILVRSDLDIEERTKTLIHELIHEAYPNWVEEIVEELTHKLYDTMAENDRGYFMFFVV